MLKRLPGLTIKVNKLTKLKHYLSNKMNDSDEC